MQPFTPRIVAAGLVLWALVSLAAPRVTQAEYTRVSYEPQAESHSEPYAGWLLGSYLTAPLLAAGAAYAFSGFDQRDITGENIVAGIAVGLLLPASIHATHDEVELGARAYFLWPLFAVGGAVVGGLVGLVFYTLSPSSDSDDEDDYGGLLWVAGCGLLGLGIGAIAWPVLDIVDTTKRDESRGRQGTRVSFSVLPHPRGGVVGNFSGSF